MKESIVFDKSKGFALRIIALYKYLCDEKKEFILSKQLLRKRDKYRGKHSGSELCIQQQGISCKNVYCI